MSTEVEEPLPRQVDIEPIDTVAMVEPAPAEPVPEVEAAPSPRWTRTKHVGKMALRGTAVLAIMSVPAVGIGVETAAHFSTTKLPMHIAGANVTVTVKPGSTVNTIEILETTFTKRSHRHIGRRDYGVSADFNLSGVDSSDTKTLEELLQAFGETSAQKQEITSAVKRTERDRALMGFGATMGLELAGVGYLRSRRRKYAAYTPEVAATVRRDRQTERRVGYAVAAAGYALAGSLPAIQYFSRNHPEAVTPDPNMQGSIFAGSQVTGPLKPLIDLLVPGYAPLMQAKAEYRQNSIKHVQEAIAATYGSETVPKDPHDFRVVMVDDFQGIDVTTGAVDEIVRLYKPDLVLVDGDTLETGQSFETNVVDGLEAIRDKYHTPVVFTSGRHDSLPVLSQMVTQRGFIMANEKVQEVNGIRILGMNEATRDVPGFPSTLVQPGVTDADKAKQAIKILCAQPAGKPVIFFAHDSKALGQPVANSGCTPLVETGRHIDLTPPARIGSTTWDIISSTGGHTPGGFDLFGLPQSTVSLEVADFNKDSYEQTQAQRIVLTPDVDAKVTIQQLMGSAPSAGQAAGSNRRSRGKLINSQPAGPPQKVHGN